MPPPWPATAPDGRSRNPGPRDPIDHIRDAGPDGEEVYARGEAAATGPEVALTATRPFLFHGSIGPSAAVALWRGDHLTAWSHAQEPCPLRAALAVALGMPPERVDVIHTPGAGSYGHNGADDAAHDAALLARRVPERPVRLVWSRADEFRNAPMGAARAATVAARLDPEGRIVALRVAVSSPPHANRPGDKVSPNMLAAARLATPFPFARSDDVPLARGGGADRNAVPIYEIPNFRVTRRLVHNLPYRTSSLRSLGAHLNILPSRR